MFLFAQHNLYSSERSETLKITKTAMSILVLSVPHLTRPITVMQRSSGISHVHDMVKGLYRHDERKKLSLHEMSVNLK